MTGSFDFPEDEWSQISEMAKDIVRKYVLIIVVNFLSPHSARSVSSLLSRLCLCSFIRLSSRQAAEGEARGEAHY